jgi:hypothetical protein
MYIYVYIYIYLHIFNLGNLHCLLALGEFVELEECALALKNHLKAAEQVHIYMYVYIYIYIYR